MPAELHQLISCCLAKIPRDRLPSANERIARLATVRPDSIAMMPVFAELKRRRVFRSLFAYGIAAFATLQIIEPIMHGLRWPDAVLSMWW